MKAIIWQLLFGCTLGILIMFVYKKHASIYEDNVNPHSINTASKFQKKLKNANEAEITMIKTSMIVIPKPLHRIKKTLTYTNYIGTTDHPTIDGGIINSTDSMIVNRDVPIETKLKNNSSNIALSSPKFIINQEKIFKDEWATDNKIRQFLTVASRQNKLDYVLQKSKEMGLPASVAAVPMVESGYQGNAISYKGAGGAWQLMPKTAKFYGVDNVRRFNFTTSTDAALKYLNDLHNQFGNWELAFAAYNAGSKRVNDAIQKNPDAKEINELDLPQETKFYVNRVKALNKAILETSFHGI